MDKFTVVGEQGCHLYGPESLAMCRAFVSGYTKTGDFGGWDWIDIKDAEGQTVLSFADPNKMDL